MNVSSGIFKIEAAGNDFIFIESSHPFLSAASPLRDRVRRLCDRHFGIGADGLAVMFRKDSKRTRWDFFNSDGSAAAMCGNAARAAAAWLVPAGGEFPHILETAFGDVVLSRGSGDYSATISYLLRPLSKTVVAEASMAADTRAGTLSGTLIDTGVPHVVLELPDLKQDLPKLAARFRWVKEAGPDGANVTFFSRISSRAIESVTFERGVEDLTLACGTGVLAAASVASDFKNWPSAGYEVQTPGAMLFVESKDFPNSLTLRGPANIVFEAKLAAGGRF